MEGELIDFLDWYNAMRDDVEGKTSTEIINMYMYFSNNKI